jgi:hypothetical protein
VSGPPPSLSADGEYAADYPSKSTVRLLQLRRSLVGPIIVFVGVALLAAFAVTRLDKTKPQPEIEVPAPPKQPDGMTEQQAPTEPTDPFKSLVLDVAQLYLATGRLPAATTGRSR